jgi:hypothetical protein
MTKGTATKGPNLPWYVVYFYDVRHIYFKKDQKVRLCQMHLFYAFLFSGLKNTGQPSLMT